MPFLIPTSPYSLSDAGTAAAAALYLALLGGLIMCVRSLLFLNFMQNRAPFVLRIPGKAKSSLTLLYYRTSHLRGMHIWCIGHSN